MKRLIKLFNDTFGTKPTKTEPITGSGSARRYYRLSSDKDSAIGVIGNSLEENRAFIGLTRHFEQRHLPVPTIYGVSDDGHAYLQNDLGRSSLYDTLTTARNNRNYTEIEYTYLDKAIRLLPRMQMLGAEGLDLSLCYPTPKMDATSIHFDLNYFKYCFLKLLSEFDFNEIRLEKDFDSLCHDILLLSNDSSTLILRDCQARNIMMTQKGKETSPFFIDYQGCRIGPKEYDLASFLWQSSAHYPQTLRDRLIKSYIEELQKLRPETDSDSVYRNLNLMVLFRMIQVLGAYGFRGYIEHKKYFLDSIPCAINNLQELMQQSIVSPYPYLEHVLKDIVSLLSTKGSRDSQETKTQNIATPGELTVTIYSFSFKKGIPDDDSGNGGGYIFDCRSTHNPGKYEQYKAITGLDQPVIEFLEKDGEITEFLKHVYPIVQHHTARFIERKFTSLMICFGCTGGQHRSVYCAQHTAEFLRNIFPNIKIHLIHREQNIDTFL